MIVLRAGRGLLDPEGTSSVDLRTLVLWAWRLRQVGVGGQLRMGLKWDTEAGALTIKISCISGLQLLHLQPPLQDSGTWRGGGGDQEDAGQE